MNKIKLEKGITLVALIITVVVLLILALVAIRGIEEDGIVDHAKDAELQYERAQARLEVENILAKIEIKKNIYGENVDITQEFENIETNGNNKYKVTQNGYDFTIKYDNGNYEIIDENSSEKIKWLSTVRQDGTMAITGFDVSEFLENDQYSGTSPSITIDLEIDILNIPSTINGVTVTSFNIDDTLDQIWDEFKDIAHYEEFTGIRKIILPNTIKELKLSGFMIFPDIEEIILPTSIESIMMLRRQYGFDNIENISIPNSVTYIEENSFWGIDVVNFPNGINEALTVPDDLWGATKLTVTENGVTTTTYPTTE